MEVINWTPQLLARFVRAVEKAEADQVIEFDFDGYPFVVSYAKHLIVYLTHTFNASPLSH